MHRLHANHFFSINIYRRISLKFVLVILTVVNQRRAYNLKPDYYGNA